jgi:two-component system response regulator
MFPQHTLHILIAEDDKDDILFINLGFKKYAAFSKIDIVRDGEELLNFLSKLSPDQFPDVILTDLNMPRKSGYEAIVELNAHPLFSKIPLLV